MAFADILDCMRVFRGLNLSEIFVTCMYGDGVFLCPVAVERPEHMVRTWVGDPSLLDPVFASALQMAVQRRGRDLKLDFRGMLEDQCFHDQVLRKDLPDKTSFECSALASPKPERRAGNPAAPRNAMEAKSKFATCLATLHQTTRVQALAPLHALPKCSAYHDRPDRA